MTFVNHGCNSSYNIGTWLPVNEYNATLDVGPESNGYFPDWFLPFDPFAERRFPPFNDVAPLAQRDIEAGEELVSLSRRHLTVNRPRPSFLTQNERTSCSHCTQLDNYLLFGSGAEDWETTLRSVRRLCSGVAGSVTEYEKAAANGVQTTRQAMSKQQ